jgi:hypothetical protein
MRSFYCGRITLEDVLISSYKSLLETSTVDIFLFRPHYINTMFMVFSVMYTICEGPKLDA